MFKYFYLYMLKLCSAFVFLFFRSINSLLSLSFYFFFLSIGFCYITHRNVLFFINVCIIILSFGICRLLLYSYFNSQKDFSIFSYLSIYLFLYKTIRCFSDETARHKINVFVLSQRIVIRQNCSVCLGDARGWRHFLWACSKVLREPLATFLPPVLLSSVP